MTFDELAALDRMCFSSWRCDGTDKMMPYQVDRF
jgi:hypothetical protein